MNKVFLPAMLLLSACSSYPHREITDGGDGTVWGGELADSAPVADPDPCGIHSGQPGDERCLPEATLHYGPTSYDDPATLAPYLLAPGAESVVCREVMAAHPATLLAGYETSERLGMHHFSLFTGTAGATSAIACGTATNPIFLIQRPYEKQVMGDGAPEYADAALGVPAGSYIIQAHALNNTDVPALVEGWIRLTTVSSTSVRFSALALSGGHLLNVPPHAKQTISTSAPVINLPASIVQLVGHFHAHTTQERVVANGREVYRTDSWSEPTVKWFTSLTGGALVIPVATVAPVGYVGPKVGAFEITPSTSIQWACDIDNTTDAALRYANEVQTAEMCNVFGFVVGVRPWEASL